MALVQRTNFVCSGEQIIKWNHNTRRYGVQLSAGDQNFRFSFTRIIVCARALPACVVRPGSDCLIHAGDKHFRFFIQTASLVRDVFHTSTVSQDRSSSSACPIARFRHNRQLVLIMRRGFLLKGRTISEASLNACHGKPDGEARDAKPDPFCASSSSGQGANLEVTFYNLEGTSAVLMVDPNEFLLGIQQRLCIAFSKQYPEHVCSIACRQKWCLLRSIRRKAFLLRRRRGRIMVLCCAHANPCRGRLANIMVSWLDERHVGSVSTLF